MSWIKVLRETIKSHGGLKKSFLVLFRTDSLKLGKLEGTDEMGNKYYSNTYYFFPTNRWVIYSDKFGYDYDGSQIHPSWFRWIHCMTDLKPDEEKNRVTYKWMLPYTENPTGTQYEYVPYSTTQPRITPWKPKNSKHTNTSDNPSNGC